MASRPPSPPLKGYFSAPFERFVRDEPSDWAGAFTLLGTLPTKKILGSMWCLTLISPDTVETYFDSHVDLLQRKLQKHSDRLKLKAEETFKIKDLSGDLLAENFDREFKGFKVRVRRAFVDAGELSILLNTSMSRFLHA